MQETKNSPMSNSDFPVYKTFWSLYLLMGLQSLAYAGFTILVVPLSSIIWPDEPYHALEIGILIAVLFWVSSISGLFFGILIDNLVATLQRKMLTGMNHRRIHVIYFL